MLLRDLSQYPAGLRTKQFICRSLLVSHASDGLVMTTNRALITTEAAPMWCP
jgi:hypothetical protein